MISSKVRLGSLGGVSCQFLSVAGADIDAGDVAGWIATKPWVIPSGRLAVSFKAVPHLVRIAIMASLASQGFYELMVGKDGGYVTVASTDPQNIGNLYPDLPSASMEVLREAGSES